MTPAARVQAAIDILDAVLAGTPAEQALTGWARGARYAGSKDRAAVRDHVFQALRCRRSYAALGGDETGRGLMLGQLRDSHLPIDELFSGVGHGPPPVNDVERAAGRTPRPGTEAMDLPDWLWNRIVVSLGEEAAERTAQLLRQRAPVALRVNPKMKTVTQAIEILEENGISARSIDEVKTGLVVTDGARKIRTSHAYLDGVVELQDIASQAAMAQLDVPAGGRVLDYCAGGGGKTLALAGQAEAKWFVHDTAVQRMRDLPARAARAGTTVTTLATNELEMAAPFDLVLCDAPCSGSGTWRRSPEAKWRLSETDLERFHDTQVQILQHAESLVAPAGRLAYVTCSILTEENEETVAAFLASSPGWHQCFSRIWPVTQTQDGFYLCVFEREASA
ncbi:RsmB/NOP family class I SAM-dependent RNA methyltransferase [Roseovarius aestuariivivens]|uniref:RsmB/NOP family class I SAM-dependent RNA methyltransferase n=1 Tax=Roseovarius aestuariivivens TaxID=1888910 RepID=UPI0010811A40|nr:RsmB/NOP family class I SAM-dependent RNA methyltransferase [Roseovarius aestuariivivens]